LARKGIKTGRKIRRIKRTSATMGFKLPEIRILTLLLSPYVFLKFEKESEEIETV